MAESFRHDLLQTSNIVPGDPQNLTCVICLQETGTMSRETGLFELQVRLPCGHVVGSGCIAVWLKDNNSCPMCRREFFPAQPRPWLQEEEDGETEDDEDVEIIIEEEDEERRQLLEANCQNYCIQLDLDRTTIEISKMIIQNLLCLYPFSQVQANGNGNLYDNNAVRLVALGIYVASCLTGHPRSPREICRVEDVNGARIQDSCAINGSSIRGFYNLVYEEREELIDNRIRESLEGRDVVWPSDDLYDGSDDQIECRRDLLAMRVHCVNECAHLEVSSPIDDLAQHIAANLIRAGFHAFSHPDNSTYLSEPEVTAVSIYIASHLIGRPLSRRALQDRIGNDFPDILSTYQMVTVKCNPLVSEDFPETLDVQLSWESLEAEVGTETDDGRHGHHGEEYSTQGEPTSVVPGTVTRTQRVRNLSTNYCNRLDLGNTSRRTISLARLLSERFNSSPTFVGCSPESIAAACVYVAGVSTDHRLSYADLVAATAVSITSIHTTHMMMVREINFRRVNIEDIAQSLSIDAQSIGHSLRPLDAPAQ